MQSLQSTVTLNNGVAMPIFGLGVYNSKEETTFAVSTAIKHGYRLIDTAAFYENEKEVGEGIKDSGIPRDDLFITTKLWNDMQRESRQRESFEKSLDNLGVDAVDLYLIHWPIPGKIKETWHVLEQLYEEGLVRALTTRFCKISPKNMKKTLHRLFCATMYKTASSQFQSPPKKHESSAIRRFLILN